MKEFSDESKVCVQAAIDMFMTMTAHCSTKERYVALILGAIAAGDDLTAEDREEGQAIALGAVAVCDLREALEVAGNRNEVSGSHGADTER